MVWLVVGFAGVVLAIAFAGWLVAAARPARMLARLDAPVAPAALEEHVGKRVVVEGSLTAPAATFFPQRIAAIEDADVRARTVEGAHGVSLSMGKVELGLDGPVQVVLGSEERARVEGAEPGVIRRLGAGERVFAEGVVRRVAGKTGDSYRDRAHAYDLAPPEDAGSSWKDRPIALYAAARPRRAIPLSGLVMASAIAALGAICAVGARRAPSIVIASGPPTPARPACAAEIDALLDRNDPWAAEDALRTCDDPRAAAETAWMLGDFARAASAWKRRRAMDPGAAVTASEVEAAILADPTDGAGAVAAMKADWYRGPHDKSQDTLDCAIKELSGGGPTTLACLAGRHNVYGWTSFGLHNMPNYALHEPSRYFRFQPLGAGVGQRCGSTFAALEEISDHSCLAEIGVMRAIFAAVAGDEGGLAMELRETDRLRADLAGFAAEPPAVDVLHVPEGMSLGDARVELEKETAERVYAGQRSLAVAAAAAWVGHDDARARLYLPWVSAHERAILGEHLDLVSGKLASPDPSHSPSDYSALDMDMFDAVARDTPEAFARKLEDRGFTAPTRLAALLASRPAYAAALEPWVRRGFGKVCRTCGIYPLLDGTYRRREAARLAGARDLESRLLAVTKKIAAALGGRVPSRGANAVVSIESLVDDAR